MHDELTRKDIEMMQKELDERRTVLRPKLLEEVMPHLLNPVAT